MERSCKRLAFGFQHHLVNLHLSRPSFQCSLSPKRTPLVKKKESAKENMGERRKKALHLPSTMTMKLSK
jgi:hypothetical protein